MGISANITIQNPAQVGTATPKAKPKTAPVISKPSTTHPKRVIIDRDAGRVRVEFSDGSLFDAGIISPRVIKAKIDDKGHLIMTYDDGAKIDAGPLIGLVEIEGLRSLEQDPNPKLGGNLNLNGYGITPALGQTVIIDGGNA